MGEAMKKETPSEQQILASFVVRMNSREDRVYQYKDPSTERVFEVRRSETLDAQDNPCFQYFLEEYAPIGRIVECDAKGNAISARDEPLIKEIEERIGPNGLMRELHRLRIDVTGLVLSGGGYCVGNILHSSLEDCAKAIAVALESNERYRYFQPLSEQDQIKLARDTEKMSHAYWSEQAAALEKAEEVGQGLFKGCFNLFGPLDRENQARVLNYLNQPSLERWLEVRSLCICGPVTLWQAWVADDPTAPRQGSSEHPTAEALRKAIRNAVENRRQEIAEKCKMTNPSGLTLVR